MIEIRVNECGQWLNLETSLEQFSYRNCKLLYYGTGKIPEC